MSWFLTPFSADFMARALVGGVLIAVLCAVVGTWVVTRGMAFLGEAIGHGMLPGVAIASLAGWPAILGGAVSAIAMSAAIGGLQRRGRLSYDTSIGLLFVGMLSLGIIIVSHSRSFATDATVMLFGDILAVDTGEIVLIACALAVTLVTAALLHRSFVAAAFDPRIAQTLGLRPQLAHVMLTGLVTLAVVSSYQAVGSLLVVGMLLAPAVAAGPWTRTIASTMALASIFGTVAVIAGLLISWHAATSTGPTIAGTAILLAGASSLTASLMARRRTTTAAHAIDRPHRALSAFAPPTAGASPPAPPQPAHDPPAPTPSASGAPASGPVRSAHDLSAPPPSTRTPVTFTESTS
ncbi:zinc ABC transporter permease AztB [Microbacterium suaedae]|uniref:zinc ABC transporter permease AztB n=1 Tax=Microbacterium suaedae TaxID=2067813 RepID=UPI000DA1CDA9|nr:zinc ABC transporter permease AztB [Microbacterium suaedae]